MTDTNRAMPDNIRCGVYGVSGNGKTQYVKEAIKALRARRLIVVDPNNEYDCEIRVNIKEFTPNWLRRMARRKSYSIGVSFHGVDDKKLAAEYYRFAESIDDAACDLVVMEECGEISENGGMKALKLIATQGRHWGCDVIFVAQTAAQVHKTVRRQMNHVVTFWQTDEDDIKAMRPRFKEKAVSIETLGVGEYMTWTRKRGVEFGRMPWADKPVKAAREFDLKR